MKAYQPSNIVPMRGYLFLILAALVGGAAIGGATFLVDKLVYLVCLFPILMGVIGGALIGLASKLGKVRSPLVAVLFSILIGLVIYASFLFFSYLGFREDVYNEVVSSYGEIERAEVEQFIDITLQEEYGQEGFLGFMSYLADEGIQIGRVGSSGSSDINLDGTAAWIYWGVELLIIVVGAVLLGRTQASQPFCEACDEWLGKEKGIGLLPSESIQEGLRLAQSGAFRPLGEMLVESAVVPYAAVVVESCAGCMSTESRLTLKQVAQTKKNQTDTRILAQGMITPAQLSDLSYAVRTRPSGDPAALNPPVKGN